MLQQIAGREATSLVCLGVDHFVEGVHALADNRDHQQRKDGHIVVCIGPVFKVFGKPHSRSCIATYY